jgi:hypothetical protein
MANVGARGVVKSVMSIPRPSFHDVDLVGVAATNEDERGHRDVIDSFFVSIRRIDPHPPAARRDVDADHRPLPLLFPELRVGRQ